jgi:hypothetical protein
MTPAGQLLSGANGRYEAAQFHVSDMPDSVPMKSWLASIDKIGASRCLGGSA